VPTFFSTKPEETLKQLQMDPEYAFECLQALVSKLIARRELSRAEAEAYYPDPREGDFRRLLKRGWPTDGGKGKLNNKRTTNHGSTDTNMYKTTIKCQALYTVPSALGKTGKGKHAKNSKQRTGENSSSGTSGSSGPSSSGTGSSDTGGPTPSGSNKKAEHNASKSKNYIRN